MKTVKLNLLSLLVSIVVIVGVISSDAHARGGSGNELSHFLSNGYGVSSPGTNLAIYENPSGLLYNIGPKVQASVAAGDGFDPANPGAHLLLGNGSVGAAIGYRHRGSSGGEIEYGLAAGLDSLNVAFGLGGGVALNDNDASNTDLNLGMLFNPHGKLTFGLTAYGIVGGVSGLGGGLAYDLSQSATFVVDTRTNSELDAWSLKPGLGIHLQELQLVVGYGLDVVEGNSGGSEGVSFGLGFRLGSSAHLAFYVDQYSKYFASLQFRL
jgi:hypothetical protein